MTTEIAETKHGEVTKISNQPATTPAQLLELAVNKDLDLEKLERLMAMQEQWEAKQAKKLFFEALANFQERCPRIIKRKQGHNYKYAPLGDIIEQIRPALKECGLTYRFEQNEVNGLIEIACVLTHVDGHSERTKMSAEDDTSGSKNTIQAKGSTVTYLQRYTLIGALGIATADEDIDARLPQKPVETITEQQALDLQALLEDKGYPLDEFLKKAKVDSVDNIAAGRYDSAIKHIKSWSSK